MRKAVFLDRDGVINQKMPEGDYVKNWEEFSFLPGVLRSLKVLKDNNYLLVLITNQRCIARQIISESELREIHRRMSEAIREVGADLDAIYYCPHENDENCGCRKPAPGMINRAITDFSERGITVDKEASYMIGDSEKDVLAGRSAGLNTIIIGRRYEKADISCENLHDAVSTLTNGNVNDN